MSELGDLLELLYGARGRWRTARVTIREWHQHERAQRAYERRHRPGAAQLTVYGPGPPEPEQESVARVWLDGDRAREERDDMLSVRDGDRWWMWSPHLGAHTNEDDVNHTAGVGDAALRLLDPTYVLAALRLEPVGEAEAVGRATLRVVGRERESARDLGVPLFHLGYGADEYELLVDRERGVLLRLAALLDGEPFAVTELVEVAFDEDLPDETFVFTLPDGEIFRGPPRPQRTTLHAAAAGAPFRVLAPAGVPDGWRLQVLAIPATDRPPLPASVVLHYHSSDAAYQVNVQQTSADAPEQHEWIDWLAHGDVDVAPVDAAMGAWVRAVRDGTRVVLSSNDLELDALVALARSLRPAPTEPPLR